MATDIRTAGSVEEAIKMVDDKVERLVRAAGPRGPVATPVALLAAGTINTTETVQPEAVTFTAVQGRLYTVTHIRSEAILTGTPILTSRFRVANAASITTSSTLIRSFPAAPTGSFRAEVRICWWVATFSGEATIGLTSVTNLSGTAQVDAVRERDLLVEEFFLPA